ncbi:MAG: hypothetical protein ACJ8FP_24005, partial [Xanthobacteraceae bacterium]
MTTIAREIRDRAVPSPRWRLAHQSAPQQANLPTLGDLTTMIVDFQHHFTPRELIKEDPGDRLIVHYDESGAPSYTVHRLLYDLDEHIRMMDLAGIDAALLTSAAGM